MKTIIEMAREAGFDIEQGALLRIYLDHFAELVRADERNRTWTQEHWTEYERSIAAQEREACAKVCDEAHELMNSSFQGAAAAIRERGRNAA
jgi:hypothetical protein